MRERERRGKVGVGDNEGCSRSWRALWTTVEAFPLCEMRGVCQQRGYNQHDSQGQYLELGTAFWSILGQIMGLSPEL